MGEHIDASRSLKVSEFEGEAEQFVIEGRDTMNSWQQMAVYRRKQFPHGSRHEERGSRFLCTQKTASKVRLRELLVKLANHLVVDLMNSKEVLRVLPEAWAATDPDRERQPGGNGWAAVVTNHQSTHSTLRMKLYYIDQQVTLHSCNKCGDIRWESDGRCSCEAPATCELECGREQVASVRQILQWMLDNQQEPAEYSWV
eukprot:709728-Rhodomonas_salina.3